MKPRLVRRQANHYPEGYSPLIGRLLSGRGITSDAEASLELAGLLHPDSLKGIDEAASLLADAVCRQASVLIVGDFDADGATSTALMVRVLTAFGAQQVR
ncbi:MAG: hypothetical protein KDI36_17920 [Pseudomonadales bacterium]|nr:hypothetical protein [Pseudomonadales bacterium]